MSPLPLFYAHFASKPARGPNMGVLMRWYCGPRPQNRTLPEGMRRGGRPQPSPLAISAWPRAFTMARGWGARCALLHSKKPAAMAGPSPDRAYHCNSGLRACTCAGGGSAWIWAYARSGIRMPTANTRNNSPGSSARGHGSAT